MDFMKMKYLLFRNLLFYIVCSSLHTTQSFGQSINVTTNGPQTITINSASLTSNASSNNTINTTQWTKFSAPGQTLKKVTVVGSSTAAGVGAPAGNAFVDKLRTYYQAEGVISDIVNLAAGGGVPFGWDINYVLNTTMPDVLMVCFPSNGYTASNNANVINRYLEFQAACNSRGIQMVVTGTQPRNDYNDADRANLITLNNLFRNTFPTQFVDFLTPLLNTNGNVIKAEYYGDGVHPNEAGHAVLFQQVRAFNMFKNTISSSSIINSPASAATNITNLTSGIHRFQVGVLDNGGFAACAVATITVNGNGGTTSPTANAGTAQSITLPASQATLSGSGTAGNGGSLTYGWTQVGGTAATIASPSSASTNIAGLTTEGLRTFRLTVTQSDNQTATSDVTVTVNPAAGGGGGNGKTIPGKIEAEAWDAKSGGMYAVATNDGGGGQHVVGISNGSWMDYNVTVTTSGIYTVGFRVATTQANAQFQLKLGATVLGTVTIPGTGGWDTWLTVPLTNVSLTAGAQTLRILSVTAATCNFNWMDFALTAGSTPPPTANAGTAQSITLPASQATLSGSGTAGNGGSLTYGWTQVGGTAATIASPSSASTNIAGLTTEGLRTFRLTVTQSDNQTATSDVTVTVNPAAGGGGGNGKTIPGKIEAEAWDTKSGGMYGVATNDAGGGQHVVGISNGSWMDYNVTVTTSGVYTVNFRVATTQNNTQFQVKLGAIVLGTKNIPNTGGWDTWQTVALNNISLTAGVQTIRIQSSNNESCNFNWMDWIFVSPPVAPVTIINLSADIKAAETKGSDMSVSVFPNPAASYFNLKVQAQSMELITIRIVDIAGRQVQQFKVMPGQAIRFGNKMMNGIYLIEVIQGSERVVKTVIRQ
jgi:lysophospholipase L1-like esterase